MITKAKIIQKDANIIYVIRDHKELKKYSFTKDEIDYVKFQAKENKKDVISLNRYGRWDYICLLGKEKVKHINLEKYRKAGNRIAGMANNNKLKEVIINNIDASKSEILALSEGMALGNYQFLKYKSDSKEKTNTLHKIKVFSKEVKSKEIDQLNIIIEAVYKCRDLINEPGCTLNAVALSKEIKAMFKGTDAKVEVLNKAKIESLKMGGLLAVNKGSIDPPTFNIIEWKPKNAINKKPIVFVGKGLVFDTGGLNLKPGGYMSDMKSDMSGGAIVATALSAIAKAKLPIYIIGLIPSTDNRPDGNAYAPDDVVTTYDGTKVEIINTDAEGRMILADALSYAKKYKPEFVIDLATLTGSAEAAVGMYGIVAMGTDSDKEMEQLKKSGMNVYERIAEFPFWEEYGELIKSDIADIKNVGGRHAGAITAGKFLEHFIEYPWIHLDVAGPAYINKKDGYRPQGGTGTGVRLLFDFINNKVNK